MEDPLIDKVNEQDEVTGTIRQSLVYKNKANFRVVHILIFSPEGKLLLQRLRPNHERYPGYWGSSAAGHVHHTESYVDAAKRILKSNLGIHHPALIPLGKLPMTDHGVTKFLTAFQCTWDQPVQLDPLEVGGLDFVSMQGPGKIVLEDRRTFTPTFRRVMIEFKPFMKAK